MKKEYTAPYAEKVSFNYRQQVVAASEHAPECDEIWTKVRGTPGGCVSVFKGWDD